ncbi:unnamed protein product [Moneuplotes crassus]|uniref:Macro domain-containing protein n=1 Tax=Euplotes crassus TaxID=5936 RepID=A0AAD1XQF5_EUPCR|nr:unnamed protein product [Moneuplotes crassus]
MLSSVRSLGGVRNWRRGFCTKERREVVVGAKTVFRVKQGDLCRLEVDAIVNAANSKLQHGGGLAKAISDRGGPLVQIESDEYLRANGQVDIFSLIGF